MNSKPTKATICALATLLLGGAITCHAQDDNELRLLPSNYIGINGGFGWLSNEIVTEDGSKINKKPKGYDLGLEYAHLWQLKNSRKPLYMGFAVNVMRNYADIEPFPINGGWGTFYDEFTNIYVGAGWKVAFKTNKSFIWHGQLGIGYAHTDNTFDTTGGLGSYWECGCDYMIGRHWAIGASLEFMSTYYRKPDGWDIKGRYGIDHNGLHAKLGYFF